MKIKKEKVEVLQQTTYKQQKGDRKVKGRDDKILGVDFVVIGQNKVDLNFIPCYYWLFLKSQFSGIQLSYMKLCVFCILECVM